MSEPFPALVLTDRLELSRPTEDDWEDLYWICSDPKVWEHFPSLRHTSPAQTRSMLKQWLSGWEANGLDTWVIRKRRRSRVIGYGGCSNKKGFFWNLGYRLSSDSHGYGFAAEVAREGIHQAKSVDPELPVIAYMLADNVASGRVAQKLGFELVHSGPDEGNPDSEAIRLVYSDRPLTQAQLAAAMS